MYIVIVVFASMKVETNCQKTRICQPFEHFWAVPGAHRKIHLRDFFNFRCNLNNGKRVPRTNYYKFDMRALGERAGYKQRTFVINPPTHLHTHVE